MKYYKILKGNWGHYKIGTIYPENYIDNYGHTPNFHYQYHQGKMIEVSYADYLKQEYDAGRIDRGCLNYEVDRGKILVWEYLKIISNNKTNNMEELKLEKNKVIETYNNGCSEVKKTLEGLFGKETFKSYRLGNIFELNSPAYYYILTQVDEKRINLIGLNSGNRYEDSIEVENICNITSKDLIRLDEDFFTKFKFVANNYKDLK